eukprot:UN33843
MKSGPVPLTTSASFPSNCIYRTSNARSISNSSNSASICRCGSSLSWEFIQKHHFIFWLGSYFFPLVGYFRSYVPNTSMSSLLVVTNCPNSFASKISSCIVVFFGSTSFRIIIGSVSPVFSK